MLRGRMNRFSWRRHADAVDHFKSTPFHRRVKKLVLKEMKAVQDAETEQEFEFTNEDLENAAWKEICKYANEILSRYDLPPVEELDPESVNTKPC